MSGTGGSGGSTVNGSGGSASEDAGSGGSQASSGGAGGTTVSGSGGDAVADSGPPPADVASDGAGGNDAGQIVAEDFTCTLILGTGQSLQWFNGGFETAVGSAKWEIKATDNTYTEAWAVPTSAFWNVQVQSPCTSNATTPDRVLFIVYSKTLTAEADWETQINKVMANIKTKFPSVKKIDLLTMVRGPDDKMCGTAVATVVSPAQDQAMKSVADASAGMITVGPQYFAPTCGAFSDQGNTNLTSAGAAAVGQMLAATYK
ncbi:MAG TPA: hypothetical protein VH374_01665 [Polyangia bacterium]|jgi:hypothetical protein|nr:hypothetical protein [Polyangia bacterium]